MNAVRVCSLCLSFALLAASAPAAEDDPQPVSKPSPKEIPRFADDSPFDTDYKVPATKPEKRLWADSWLWQEAPKLEVEDWIGKKPDLRGKYLLIEVWATWCPPCRKSLSLLGQLHRRFADELAVIAICEESAEKVEAMKAAKVECYSAVDTQKRMKTALGVNGIPHVIIVEPGGYVVWEGFPLQKGYELTEEVVDKILAVGRAEKKASKKQDQ